ncbi:MAG: ABC transporter ATP-binding protein [bacterium]|nr:ABC transporter ATP-binding protein [bacterium]
MRFAFKMIRKAFREYRRQLFIMLILGFLAGLFGGLGISAIIPIFTILTGESAQEADIISELIEKIFAFLHLPFNLPFLVFFIAFLFLLKALVQFSARYFNTKIAAEYEEAIRNKLFNVTMRSRWQYLLNQKSGFLERIIMNDSYRSSDIIFRVANLILLGTSLAMYAVVALGISAVITLMTVGFGVILFLIFKPLFYKTRKVSEELASTEKVVAHYVSESIIGAKIMKTLSVEEKLIERNKSYFEKLRESRKKTALYTYSVSSSYEPIGFIFIAILFIFYNQRPDFNIISFAAVIYLVQKMFAYAQAIQGNAYQVMEAVPYLKVINDYNSLSRENKEQSDGEASFNFKNVLEFKDVEFSYDDERGILKDVNFSIKKGEMVGLVGPSGSGKTTIADLLLRLFYPGDGRILMDGVDISEINIKDWRSNVGYASQDMFLLNDTIAGNIRFFDGSILESDIISAAKDSNIYDLIKKLPAGFDTPVGERGVKLSMGQRQRVVLARALARKPQILILDEATSSLDAKSEGLIQQAIENLKGKITVIAIAHRLSTVMKSDKLIVLDEGKILEQGSPGELLKNKDSHFYKMYNIRGK